MSESKQINFTIVPDEGSDATRTYANFCAVNHTPFPGCRKDNIRFNGTRRVNDHPRADAAIMSYTAAQYRAV